MRPLRLPASAFDDIAKSEATLVGSADTIVRRIESIREAIDLNYLLGRFQFGGLDPAKPEDAMRRFADDVIQEFR